MSHVLTDIFSKEKIESIAKETNFVKRERTIDGHSFAHCLIFTKFNGQSMSLENLAEDLSKMLRKPITKQAVDLRFTQEAVAFFKRLIEEALRSFYAGDAQFGFLGKFKEVRIKDSTSFQLPDEMAEKYPGSGGSSSKASVRIQFEYDAKTGKVLDLGIFPFVEQDHCDAHKTLDKVGEGVLVVRDLGYSSIKAFRGIKQRDGFFISRLMANAEVWYIKNGRFAKIDFNVLTRHMKRNGLMSMEFDAYITKQKEPVRMVVELMPQEEADRRISRAQKQAQKNGKQAGQQQKARAGLNIFVTNIDKDTLSKEQVHKVYTLRWQVELVFKIWKSIGEINKVKGMKVARFECLLYAKLLWILANWQIVWQFNKQIYESIGKLLSYYKAFKSLKAKTSDFCAGLAAGTSSLAEFLAWQFELAKGHQFLDRKKGKNSIYELLQIL